MIAQRHGLSQHLPGRGVHRLDQQVQRKPVLRMAFHHRRDEFRRLVVGEFTVSVHRVQKGVRAAVNGRKDLQEVPVRQLCGLCRGAQPGGEDALGDLGQTIEHAHGDGGIGGAGHIADCCQRQVRGQAFPLSPADFVFRDNTVRTICDCECSDMGYSAAYIFCAGSRCDVSPRKVAMTHIIWQRVYGPREIGRRRIVRVYSAR